MAYKLNRRPSLLVWLTNAANGPLILALLLVSFYTLLPLFLVLVLDLNGYFVRVDRLLSLAALSLLAGICIWIGSKYPYLDRSISGQAVGIAMPASLFHVIKWALFLTFTVVAWATATDIPLLAAFGGADPESIAILREQFLKAREGWQASLVYVSALLSGALIPYSIALMFLFRLQLRWIAFAFFLIYCISFVEKAFFLKAVLPLFILSAQKKIRAPVSPATIMTGILILLFAVTIFSGAGSNDNVSDAAYFSAGYIPHGPIDHLIWRSFAVPVITAADAMEVLNAEFGGKNLWGATSTFFAALTGQERVEFERLVFAFQWGQNETGTGSANSVFVTEAYANFGIIGVALFSLLIGWIMRLFARSSDEAFRSLWLLFALAVLTSGLIGVALSNGFILLFFLVLLGRMK